MKTKKLKANATITRRIVDKRIAIAKDVIAQINIGSYQVQTGAYVQSNEFYYNENREGDLQKIVKKSITPRKPCRVCTLGAAFISAVRLYDRVKVLAIDFSENDFYQTSKLKSVLREVFKKSELEWLETSFEESPGFLQESANSGEPRRWAFDSAVFYRAFLRGLSDIDRLVFLMEAVIAADKQTVTLEYLQSYMLTSLADGSGRYNSVRDRVLLNSIPPPEA